MMISGISQPEVESHVPHLSRSTFLLSHQRLEPQAYMEECEAQILQELSESTINSLHVMASESPATVTSDTVKSPPMATHSQPSNPLEALQW